MEKQQTVNQEIYQRVSLELGIPVEVIQEVAGYQGKYTVSVMETGMFETIMWPYLGKIAAPPTKVQNKNDKVGRTPYYTAK